MADTQSSTADGDTEHPCKKPRLETEDPGPTDSPNVQSTSTEDTSHILSETEVGIIEYISSHQGFSGVIKQRFSDFLVNEIQLDGNISRLTDISEPKCDLVKVEVRMDVLTEDWVKQLDDLQQQEQKDGEVFLEASEDKQIRGQVHQAIKAKYPDLDTTTAEKDGVKVIKVIHSSNKDRKQRASWPQGRGNYCHFVLYKENKDTMEAVDLLTKFLRVKPGVFNFAGTKDRRAKTCQLLSVYRMEAAKLHALNARLKGIALGDFTYSKEQLRLGDLKGNHFNIILRNVTGSTEQIQQGVSSLRDVGFINYYGMQRFGTTSVPTHLVGRALLKGNWQEAIELILKPRNNDKDFVEEARRVWWETRDSKLALRKLGSRHCVEKHLLVGLCKYSKTELLNALNCIPRNSRLMYVHAYQSYVWNAMVSRRLQEFGMKPVVRDLVMGDDSVQDEDGDLGNTQDSSKKTRQKPTFLTVETLPQHSIYSVVLPQPGFDVVYPDNVCKQWYEEIHAKDGLDLGSYKNKVKDYSLPGGYRKILVKPDKLTWKQFTYDDVTVPLVLSDFDRLQGVELEPPPTDGKYQALQLEFSLPSSTYATMAIREVLKCDTSAAHQSTLNVT